MKFLTKMWHPNIFTDGQVCSSILHKPGYDEHNSYAREDEKYNYKHKYIN